MLSDACRVWEWGMGSGVALELGLGVVCCLRVDLTMMEAPIRVLGPRRYHRMVRGVSHPHRIVVVVVWWRCILLRG